MVKSQISRPQTQHITYTADALKSLSGSHALCRQLLDLATANNEGFHHQSITDLQLLQFQMPATPN